MRQAYATGRINQISIPGLGWGGGAEQVRLERGKTPAHEPTRSSAPPPSQSLHNHPGKGRVCLHERTSNSMVQGGGQAGGRAPCFPSSPTSNCPLWSFTQGGCGRKAHHPPGGVLRLSLSTRPLVARLAGWGWHSVSRAPPSLQAFAIRVMVAHSLPSGYQYGPFTQRLRGEGGSGRTTHPGKPPLETG